MNTPVPQMLHALRSLEDSRLPVQPLAVVPAGGSLDPLQGIRAIEDAEGMLQQRYDAQPGTFYLLRPDQHVCGRWRELDVERVRAAVARATCNEGSKR